MFLGRSYEDDLGDEKEARGTGGRGGAENVTYNCDPCLIRNVL